jgi:hypothetical protein
LHSKGMEFDKSIGRSIFPGIRKPAGESKVVGGRASRYRSSRWSQREEITSFSLDAQRRSGLQSGPPFFPPAAEIPHKKRRTSNIQRSTPKGKEGFFVRRWAFDVERSGFFYFSYEEGPRSSSASRRSRSQAAGRRMGALTVFGPWAPCIQ